MHSFLTYTLRENRRNGGGGGILGIDIVLQCNGLQRLFLRTTNNEKSTPFILVLCVLSGGDGISNLMSLPLSLCNDAHRPFYSDIDDSITVGSFPMQQDVAWLKEHGVVGVINMCIEWPGPADAYAAAGIKQIRLRTVDTTAPSLESLKAGRS